MGVGVGHTDGDEDYTPLVPQVRVRVLVACASPEQFVLEYHRFVKGDRIFIATDAVEAVGTLVQFRVDLADGRAVLHGTGTVLQTRPQPHDGLPRGMVLRYVALDEASARLIESMAARRSKLTPATGVMTMDAPPAGSEELRVARPAHESDAETHRWAKPGKDATAPFRLIGGPNAAETWRTQSVERELVLPANPFGDVSEAALAYFVDWSIERNGLGRTQRGPSAVAFHAVRMEAPRRPRPRVAPWVPFVIGLATGGVAIVALFHVCQELSSLMVSGHERSGAPAAQVARVAPAPPALPKRIETPRPIERPRPVEALKVVAVAAPVAPVAPVAPAKPATTPGGGELAPLVVTAEPSAQVMLDGQRVGHTPLTLRVLRGPHVVELVRPRYQTAHVEIEAPGKTDVRLERPRATVHVTSNVANAEVFLDGESVGHVPVSAEVAGYERWQIEVRAPGVRSWRKRVYVKPPLTDLAASLVAE